MILILQSELENQKYFALQINPAKYTHSPESLEKINWLFQAKEISFYSGPFIGPRKEMVTPWATNAIEILANIDIQGVIRAELFLLPKNSSWHIDPMLQQIYHELDEHIFTLFTKPSPIKKIKDIAAYNQKAGLALSDQEIEYLSSYSQKIGRPMTDAELFGFAQANSEHCRHKVFKGRFILDGKIQNLSLFDWIRQTTLNNPSNIISAYTDNVAFFKGPYVEQFSPDKSRFFQTQTIESVLCLKAETHNFPTTVCAFPGAATGTGGEIRDRMGGGIGSIPGVGTVGYLTSYARVSDLPWEKTLKPRDYLYQDPATILIKASNGASDYGNKFGQPLISGTVTTFEHHYNDTFWGYDKVIMLAGGVGQANAQHAHKKTPQKGDQIVLLGGDNYRIGIGGGAVSSVNTGEMGKKLELNAVQRSNPEMQQRVYRVLRTLAEIGEDNPVISLHDHGAGGHFNCLSELLENCGGIIYMDQLPVGDPTLSDLEIIGNESQERMGLILPKSFVPTLLEIAERERCPCYIIGKCTGDGRLIFQRQKGQNPVELDLEFLFSRPPKTEVQANTKKIDWPNITIPNVSIKEHLFRVLRLTKVACKEWLTHKVDRSVTGLVAQQQTVGPYQLPLADVAVKATDYAGTNGIALSLGDRPIPGIINPEAGARLSVGESLTNIVWAPLARGMDSIILSANWMWPCNQPGENANLYRAVQALGKVCLALGIAVPTGKDSLSMSQQYPQGTLVRSPGTVIVTASGWCNDIQRIITPVIKNQENTQIAYIPFQKLPKDPSLCLGSSSLAQVYNQLGGMPDQVPDLDDPVYFKTCFNTIQMLMRQNLILAGHDISEGGIITALCEMAFAGGCGLEIQFPSKDLFYEGLGVLIQFRAEEEDKIKTYLSKGTDIYHIAKPDFKELIIRTITDDLSMGMKELRQVWQKTSYDMEKLQMKPEIADEGHGHFDRPMKPFIFPKQFEPTHFSLPNMPKFKAAIIREKGTNGDREMAYALHLAGFKVKDVTTTDITSGRESLEDIKFIVFCGGFSNSDVLGSARGWAAVFQYNTTAQKILQNYYQRKDTLSLGICNGCQLMAQLHLLYPDLEENLQPQMQINASNIFESRFLSVDIFSSPSILLQGLEGSTLGVWVAHGEGRFYFPEIKDKYCIPITYSDSYYPANPNGSQYNAAGICSPDGRHLAMMPHPERAVLPWQWGYYPYQNKAEHKITPWGLIFLNARKWLDTYFKK